VHQFTGNVGDEVETFLVGEAGHDAEYGPIRIVVLQLEFFDESLLADALAGDIFRRVFGRDQRVAVGTPGRIVDAVEDAGEPIGACADNTFEAKTKLGGLNLLRVLAADGGQIVGENEAALEKIYVAEELDSGGLVNSGRNADAIESFAREDAVIAHVVDGKDGRQILNGGIVAVRGAKKNGNHRGLPVVAVDQIGHPDLLGEFDGRPAEFGVALGIVGVFAVAVAVDSVAIEEERIVEKKIANTTMDAAVSDGGKTETGAKRNGQARDGLCGGFDVTVPGEEHGDFVAEFDERPGQGVNHVGKATRFGVRERFGSSKEDSHELETLR